MVIEMNIQNGKREVTSIRYKKTLSGIMSLFIGVACVGCSGPSQKKTTVKWIVPGERIDGFDLVERKINEITEKRLGIGVEFDFIPQDRGYGNRINAKIDAGENFDLCFTGWLDSYEARVYDDKLMALDALLEYTPKLKAALQEYLWENAEINGKIYAVPNQQISASSTALVFNKELVDKYQFDLSTVHTSEDIEPFLEILKNNEPDIFPYRTNWGYGGIITADDGEYYYDLTLETMRVVYEDGEFSVKKMTECRHALNAARKLHEWYERGYVRKDVAVAIDSAEELAEGKYGVWLETYKPGIVRQRKLLTGNDVYAVQIGKPFMTTGAGNGAMTGINSNSEHPLEAIKLLELVNTEPDILNLLTYGIEGINYIKKSDNVAERTDKIFSNSTWLFGNQFIIYTDSEDDEDIWEETQRINDSARKSPLMGFRPDTAEIKTELAGCKEILGKYNVIGNGTIDPDVYWQDFDRDLDEAGSEKIKRVLEKQISKFLSEK